jgi:hypothetical protein
VLTLTQRNLWFSILRTARVVLRRVFPVYYFRAGLGHNTCTSFQYSEEGEK